jgi:hypothetical protein
MALQSQKKEALKGEPELLEQRKRRGGNNKRNRNVPEMTKVISFMIEQVH